MSACVPSQNGLFADRRSGRASGGFARRTRSRRPKRRGCRLSARAVRYNSSPGLRRRRSIARVPVRPHRWCARRAAPTVPTDITPLRARRSRPRRRPQPQRRRSRCRRRYRRSARKRKVGRRRDAGCERRAACGFGPVEVLALMAPVAKRFLLGSAAPAQCVGRHEPPLSFGSIVASSSGIGPRTRYGPFSTMTIDASITRANCRR